MKRFKLNEIWMLLRWILFYEIFLGVVITLLNFFLDIERVYKSVTMTKFLSFEIFSLFIIIVVELLGLTQLYLLWYRKFGRVKISKKLLLNKMLISGEGKKIEFKKSMRWDYDKNEFNKELEKSILKTVAGFLNAEGGNLVIGVSDKKEIEGLGKDYQTLPKKDRDGFENYLTQIVRANIGSPNLRLININFTNIEEKDVCFIKVKPSESPVFTKINGSEEFFVRVGNSTASLSISESVNYIKNHWKTEIPDDKKQNT
jgi:hypothetical protein